MADLLAGVGRVESGEELTEKVAQLLRPVGGEVRPHRRPIVRRRCRRRQARGERFGGGCQTWIGSDGVGESLPAPRGQFE